MSWMGEVEQYVQRVKDHLRETLRPFETQVLTPEICKELTQKLIEVCEGYGYPAAAVNSNPLNGPGVIEIHVPGLKIIELQVVDRTKG